MIAEHLARECLGKLIVAGWHRGMGREDALFANGFDQLV